MWGRNTPWSPGTGQPELPHSQAKVLGDVKCVEITVFQHPFFCPTAHVAVRLTCLSGMAMLRASYMYFPRLTRPSSFIMTVSAAQNYWYRTIDVLIIIRMPAYWESPAECIPSWQILHLVLSSLFCCLSGILWRRSALITDHVRSRPSLCFSQLGHSRAWHWGLCYPDWHLWIFRKCAQPYLLPHSLMPVHFFTFRYRFLYNYGKSWIYPY